MNNPMPTLSRFAVAVAMMASALAAQTRADHLVAFVRSTAQTGNYIGQQNLVGGCKATTKLAPTLNWKPTSGQFSGGAAYDPTTDSIWVSDGLKIRNQTLSGKVLCEFNATLSSTPWGNRYVQGLAFKRSTRQLIQLELAGGGMICSALVRTYDTTKCPAVAQQPTCKPFFVSGFLGGIAYDETRDFLYISCSSAGFGGWAIDLGSLQNHGEPPPKLVTHGIMVSRLATPCTQLKWIPVEGGSEPWGMISGLGYSESSRKLFVTFSVNSKGSETLDLLMTAPDQGIVTRGKCCSAGLPNTDTFQGLAVLPGYDRQVVGTSCVAVPCGACNRMKLDLNGVPILGNRSFGFAITNAPSGAHGFCYVSPGTCAPKPLDIGLCGQVYLPTGSGMPLMLAGIALRGTTACDGSGTLRTPLPALDALRNMTLCSQWLILCSASGSGLTNAVQFTIGD